jgi:hypothetical protein
MAAGIQLPGGGETIELQQQVARLQALLEASRQVHSTIREKRCWSRCCASWCASWRWPARLFSGTGLVYGDDPSEAIRADSRGASSYPLDDRDGTPMTDLVVASRRARAHALRGRLY